MAGGMGRGGIEPAGNVPGMLVPAGARRGATGGATPTLPTWVQPFSMPVPGGGAGGAADGGSAPGALTPGILGFWAQQMAQ